jgi:hypothetical protein
MRSTRKLEAIPVHYILTDLALLFYIDFTSNFSCEFILNWKPSRTPASGSIWNVWMMQEVWNSSGTRCAALSNDVPPKLVECRN